MELGSPEADDDATVEDDCFSYIDEKIQHVLGHFVQDFQGRLSHDNLGARYGGYGSFLPIYTRCFDSPILRPPPGENDASKLTSSSTEEQEKDMEMGPPEEEDDLTIKDDFSSDIDEKIQHVLGHFMQDFQGRLSRHNLGAKYGGYGSFLPIYTRCSDSPMLQPPPGENDGSKLTSSSTEEQEKDMEMGSPERDDDSTIKDDFSSYIDEKIQHVLGHFVQDFQGGVSRDNLGAKYGGYGSFLPIYERCLDSPMLQPAPGENDGRTLTSLSTEDSEVSSVASCGSSLPIRLGACSTPTSKGRSLHQSRSSFKNTKPRGFKVARNIVSASRNNGEIYGMQP